MKKYKLNLEDLPPDQMHTFKTEIFNGVGSREFFIDPHDLIFKQAAMAHDFAYWRGGSNEDRKLSDKIYLEDSLDAVRRQRKWTRPIYFVIAYIYYGFLKMLGKYAFEYRERPCESWDELYQAFKEYQAKRR